MKKIGVIILILFTVLLVSGQGCEKTTTGGKGVFIGGKESLIAGFVEDAPSNTGNFQNEAFPVEIQLTNKGETEIGKGSVNVYLTGALYSSAAVVSSKKEGTNDDFIAALEKGTNQIVEDNAIVGMGDVKYTGTIFGDSVPLDVSAAICYPYETRLQVNDFCIPSSVKRNIEQDECTIDTSTNIIKDGDNSGASVQVSSLREDNGPDYIRVTLDINNVGSGDVVDVCKRDIGREEMNEVTVTMPSGFVCTFKEGDSNKGSVELRTGHAALRCRKDVNNPGSAYKEPVVVTLNYNYRQELSKTITINKA